MTCSRRSRARRPPLPAALCLAAVLASGCASPPDGVRSLDELTVAQRRVFLRGHAGDWRRDTDQRSGLPPPPPFKPYPADARLVDLVPPSELRLGGMPVADAIGRRRSRRKYTDEALGRAELSYLLWCTQGVSVAGRDDEGRIVQTLRTVPSGGARHPFETYLIVNRAEDLRPGVYRFLPLEHKLLLLREADDLPRAVTGACYGQGFTGDAAVVFVWTAVPRRTEWRYGCIAHRMIAIEAGHVCQNLYLASESIGAGACALLGYDQARMDALVGVDGNEEFTVYMAAVGRIAPEPGAE